MNKLTSFLIDERQAHRRGGLYHKTQVQLAYNSNRIEGSKLTEEQTRYIFETRIIRKVIYTVEQADIKSALILCNRIHRQQYEDHGNCPPGSLHHNANLHKKLGMTGMPEQKNAPCIKL